MRSSALQTHAHASNGDTGGACLLPDCSIHNSVFSAANRSAEWRAQVHDILDAHCSWISSLGSHRLTKRGHFLLRQLYSENRQPAVAEPGSTAHRRWGVSTDPDRDAPLQRQWVDPRLRNSVKPAAL